MNFRSPASVRFHPSSHFTDHREPVDGPVIEFMLAASSAERASELITIPVTEAEFQYFSQKAAEQGQTVEQWLIAGLLRAIANPEILRAQSN